MEGESIFLTIAEISVAFAGFSGVVVVMGRRSAGDWRTGETLRFWQMIEVSLTALVFSLLPIVFHHIGLPVAYTWASCSGMLALVSGIQMGRAVWRTKKAARTDKSISLSFTTLFFLVGIVVVLLLIGNTLGIGFKRTLAPYLIGVFWQLCLGCVLFWRLLRFSDFPHGNLGREP